MMDNDWAPGTFAGSKKTVRDTNTFCFLMLQYSQGGKGYMFFFNIIQVLSMNSLKRFSFFLNSLLKNIVKLWFNYCYFLSLIIFLAISFYISFFVFIVSVFLDLSEGSGGGVSFLNRLNLKSAKRSVFIAPQSSGAIMNI